MKEIVSRRHPLKFYLTIILGALFYIGLGLVLLFTYVALRRNENLESKDALLPFFGIGLFVFAGYTVYRYFKNAPVIRVNAEVITFNDQSFSVSEIAQVRLAGKQPFKYVVSFKMEAAEVEFKNGDTRYIFDDMYANSSEIKAFINKVIIEKSDLPGPAAPTTRDHESVKSDFYETFKGKQFISIRGITLWGLIIFIGIILFIKQPVTFSGIALGSVISILWFVLFSYQLNYFQLSSNYLLIRNHNFPWKKRIFRLSEISEIVFETQGKMPNCLRIITTDFKSKLFPAATLTDTQWLALKDKLEHYRTEVRNECIYR